MKSALRNSNRIVCPSCVLRIATGLYARAGDPGVRGTQPHTGVAGVSTVPLVPVRSFRINLPLLSLTCSSFSWRRRDRELETGWTHRAQAQSLSHAPCHNIIIIIIVIVRWSSGQSHRHSSANQAVCVWPSPETLHSPPRVKCWPFERAVWCHGHPGGT